MVFLTKYILFNIQDLSKAMKEAKWNSNNILQKFLSLSRIYTEDTTNVSQQFRINNTKKYSADDSTTWNWYNRALDYEKQCIQAFNKDEYDISGEQLKGNTDQEKKKFMLYIKNRRRYIQMLPQFAKINHIFKLLSNNQANTALSQIFKKLYQIEFKGKDKEDVNTMYENLLRTIISLLYTMHIIIFIIFYMLFDSIMLLCQSAVSLAGEKYKNIKLFSGIKTLQSSKISQISSNFKSGLSKNSSIRYSNIYTVNKPNSDTPADIVIESARQLTEQTSGLQRMLFINHQERLDNIDTKISEAFVNYSSVISKYDIEYFMNKLNTQDDRFKADNIILFKNEKINKLQLTYILSLIYNIFGNYSKNYPLTFSFTLSYHGNANTNGGFLQKNQFDRQAKKRFR